MRRVLGGVFLGLGTLLVLGAVFASIGALIALIDRFRFGRGIMFADAEFLALVTLVFGAAGSLVLWLGKKLVRSRKRVGT